MYRLKYVRADGVEFTLGTSPGAALFLTSTAGLFGGAADWQIGSGRAAFGDPPSYAGFPGRDITLDFVIRGQSREARNFVLSTVSPLLSAVLEFDGKYRLPVIARAWPEISRVPLNAQGQLALRSTFPFWSAGLQVLSLSSLTRDFRFPVNYGVPHRFGTLIGAQTDVVADLDTDAPSWYTIAVRGSSAVANPRVYDDGVLLAGLDGYTVSESETLSLEVLPNTIGAVVTDSAGHVTDMSAYLNFIGSYAPLMPGPARAAAGGGQRRRWRKLRLGLTDLPCGSWDMRR
jgi:hypothetical protein